MDEKEMAKMMLEIVMKANDLKKSMTALYIVHNEIKNQLQSNCEKAEAELKYRSDEQAMFRKFTEELSANKAHNQSGKPWDGILKEDR